jgi:hypothetical protein
MDKTMIGVLTGASALALVSGVGGAAASSLDQANALQPARSFADLLEPIPHATDVLRAENERSAANAEQQPLELTQYYHHHHHHHHHHHRYWPWRPQYHWRWGYSHHHHHHHHQHNYLQY